MPSDLLQINDTSDEISALIIQHLRNLNPEQKLQRINALCAFGRRLMMTDIKDKHPAASDNELRKLFAARLHGSEFVKRNLFP